MVLYSRCIAGFTGREKGGEDDVQDLRLHALQVRTPYCKRRLRGLCKSV